MKTRNQLKHLLEELKKRRAVTGPVDDLHEGQKRFIYAKDDMGRESRFVCLLSPRRFGKTEAVVRYFVSKCLQVPNSLYWLVYQHITDGKEVAWPKLIEISETYGYQCKLNGVSGICKFPNGSQICIKGSDDERRHRQFRGPRFDGILFDEAQSWHTDLRTLIQDATPGLADRRGRIFMCGTPGVLPEGFYYEVCSGRDPKWTFIRGSTFENPHTRTQIEEDLSEIKRAILTANPTLQNVDDHIKKIPWVAREYFGQWVVDTRKNIVHVDPELNYLYSWEKSPGDRYIISIDWGDENCAFVVSTYNPEEHPWLIFLEAHNLSGMLIKDHVSFIRNLQNKYDRAVVIADPGGLSKSIVREIREVHGIPIQNAIKEDRMAQIELMNSDMSTGNVKIYNSDEPDHPEKSLLARQWAELVWVENRARGTREEGRPRDIHDAALYARRYAHPHLHKEKDDGPQPGTRAWDLYQSKLIREKKEKALQRRHRKY